MRAIVAGAIVVLGAACDCSGRDVDVYRYPCTVASECGAGWTCFNGFCARDDGGLSNTGGGVGTGGGSGTGGGARQGGGAGGGSGGGMAPTCDLLTQPDCGPGFGCALNIVIGGSQGLCLSGCDAVKQDCIDGLSCLPFFPEGATDLAFHCVDAGTIPVDAPCVMGTPQQCAFGLICLPDSPDGGGLCRAFCNWKDTVCPGDDHCAEFIGEGRTGALLCTYDTCNLLAQDCATNLNCAPSAGGGAQCYSAGQQIAGDNCVFQEDCDVGLSCAYKNGNSLCYRVCNLDGGAPGCPVATACTEGTDETGYPLPDNAGLCE